MDITDSALDQIRRLWNTLERTPLHRGTKKHAAIVRQIRLRADAYLRLLDQAKGLAALRSRTNREIV